MLVENRPGRMRRKHQSALFPEDADSTNMTQYRATAREIQGTESPDIAARACSSLFRRESSLQQQVLAGLDEIACLQSVLSVEILRGFSAVRIRLESQVHHKEDHIQNRRAGMLDALDDLQLSHTAPADPEKLQEGGSTFCLHGYKLTFAPTTIPMAL